MHNDYIRQSATETLGPQVDHVVDCVSFGSCYGLGAHERGVTLLLLEEPDHSLVTVILSSPLKSGKWLCWAKNGRQRHLLAHTNQQSL